MAADRDSHVLSPALAPLWHLGTNGTGDSSMDKGEVHLLHTALRCVPRSLFFCVACAHGSKFSTCIKMAKGS